jgi:hypothetical protein
MVRMVCESKTGYICKLLIYDASGMTLQNTVLELLNPYLGLGYSVYMDNYYNSVQLTTDITPKNHIRVLSKGMFQVSDFFYN